MQRILYQANYFFRVQYLQGSPLKNVDLVRAKASQAQAILFMTNKFSRQPTKEDSRTIMQLYSVRRHLEDLDIKDTLLCAQIIQPENARKLDVEHELKNSTICLNKMRMGVIAKSCIYPGTSTLLFNLLNSFAFDEPLLKKETKNQLNNATIPDDEYETYNNEDDEENEFMDWDTEYKIGTGWEIYMTEISTRFCGYPFLDLTRVFYDRLGVVLFALKVKDLKGRKGTRLLLNPGDYVIPALTESRVEGFVIAEDNSSADLSFTPKAKKQNRRQSQIGSLVTAISKSVELGKNIIRRRTGTLDVGNLHSKSGKGDSNVKESGTSGGNLNSLHQARRLIKRQSSGDLTLNPHEKRQKRKDESFRMNFYLADKPIDLDYVTIKSSLVEEFPHVIEHIIVSGKSLSNLNDFIMPLRERRKGLLTHIVILYAGDIPHNVWAQISVFEGIFFVRGSPVSERDLQRAGVFRAAQFVLLAGQDETEASIAGDNSSLSFQELGGLEDADAIFSYQTIRRMNDELNIVIEMVKSSKNLLCPCNSCYLICCSCYS